MTAGTAFIVETRAHSNLPLVIENIHQHIPENWQIYVFHGIHNLKWLQASLPTDVLDRTRFLNLNVDVLTLGQYSSLLFQAAFWEYFPTDKTLAFQADTIINANSPHSLEEFLEYDYIGAPWSDEIRKKFDYIPDRGGNGGFCLSSRDKRIEILGKSRFPKIYSEDIWFSRQLEEFGANTPTKEIAMQFSVETIFYESPFAVHKPWALLSPEQYLQLEKSIPLLEKIRYAWLVSPE